MLYSIARFIGSSLIRSAIWGRSRRSTPTQKETATEPPLGTKEYFEWREKNPPTAAETKKFFDATKQSEDLNDG